MDIESQLHDIANNWMQLVSQPAILFPLGFGLSLGFIVSICPGVSRLNRRSDKAFYIYIANALGSGASFIAINYDDLATAMGLLTFVMASSVILPVIYFKYLDKEK